LDVAAIVLKAAVLGSIVQTAVWFAWVGMVYVLTARAFGSVVLFSELVRVMGLAFAPVGLSVMIGIAPLAVPMGVLSFGATLLLTNAAIEQAAGTDARQTSLANLAGFAVFLIFMGAFANVAEEAAIGGIAPGILFFSLDF
jgi:hypothetical protein